MNKIIHTGSKSRNMAKRTIKGQKKLFNFDLESLLLSDHSQEEKCDLETSTKELSKYPKKPKPDDCKSLNSNKKKTKTNASELNDNVSVIDNEEIDQLNDVTTFFENIGNDINKSMQVRKTRMGQFIETVISLYQSKMSEMIKRQDEEVEQFKEDALNSIQEKLNKCEEETKKLRQQENNLKKILEHHLKLLQKMTAAHEQFIEDFNKEHQNFFQTYEQLRLRHKNEALELKKTVAADVTKLQNKFLMESKKEEMQTMKKYLSSVYF